MKKLFVVWMTLLFVLLVVGSSLAADTVIVNFSPSVGAQPIYGNWMTFNQTSQPSKVYGTLNTGGSVNRGAVFSLDLSNNTFKILDDTFASQGYQPQSPVVQVSGGALYGTTFGNGTVYRLAQVNGVWTPTIVASGISAPQGGIVVLPCDNDGTKNCLYGTALNGGANLLGYIWRLNLANYTLTDMFDFTSTTGSHPAGGINAQMLWNGSANVNVLTGTTSTGGASNLGTAFTYNLGTYTFTNLHSFAGGTSDGSAPFAPPTTDPVLDGSFHVIGWNMYGTTITGGGSNAGTLWSIPYGGSYGVLHSFTGNPSDGQAPYSFPTLWTGANGHHLLVGTTQLGGSNFDGTVYAFDLDTLTQTILYSFTGGTTDGYAPFSPVLTYTDGLMRVLTEYGGSGGSCHQNQTGCGTLVTISAP